MSTKIWRLSRDDSVWVPAFADIPGSIIKAIETIPAISLRQRFEGAARPAALEGVIDPHPELVSLKFIL